MKRPPGDDEPTRVRIVGVSIALLLSTTLLGLASAHPDHFLTETETPTDALAGFDGADLLVVGVLFFAIPAVGTYVYHRRRGIENGQSSNEGEP